MPSIGFIRSGIARAAAFVSYGTAMGARGVQQLRATAIEIQMAPVRSSAEFEAQAKTMIDDLPWWTTALKTGRKA